MTLDDWLATIDEALDIGASAFQLIGGEPTLHPHFRTLLDHVGKANPRLIEVYTNATRLTDEIVGCLKDNGARVAASFYAEAPDVHDAVTMRPGSWRRTVAGLERALAADHPGPDRHHRDRGEQDARAAGDRLPAAHGGERHRRRR